LGVPACGRWAGATPRYVDRRRPTTHLPGRFILDERPCPRRPERRASWYALDASVAQHRCGSLVGAQERQKTNGSGTCNACHGEGGSFGCDFSTPTKSDGSQVLPAKAQVPSEHTVWSARSWHCGIWVLGGRPSPTFKQIFIRSPYSPVFLVASQRGGHARHRCLQDLGEHPPKYPSKTPG
jgi:hypothetical protein